MKEKATYILVSLFISVILLMLYHSWHSHEMIELESNYAIKVAEWQDKAMSASKGDISINAIPEFTEVAEYARNAVVSVKAVQVKGAGWSKDKYTRSNGSGVIVDPSGYIVTNYHVIEDADIIEVRLEDNREFRARVKGFDRSTDIALLKIDADALDHLPFGSSSDLKIGEWVLAVGNPFKLQSSVTAGIVSAKARNINIFNRQGIESFIQTDAAINPGNSGGALINTSGQLVGINTAILTYSGKYEGFSFAIPSSIVKKVVEDIRKYGAVQRAWLGVGVIDVSYEASKDLKLDFVSGVRIDLVEKDGAAADAGLRTDDVIVSVNDKSTANVSSFLEIISQYRPGDRVMIDYYRNGKVYSSSAQLKNQINTTDYIAVRKDKILTDLGFELRELDSSEQNRLGSKGLMVVSIIKDSRISDTNMDPSYIITSVNNKRVQTVDEFIRILENTKGRVELKGFYENWPGDYPYIFNLN